LKLLNNCEHITLHMIHFYRYLCIIVDFRLNLELFLQNTRT